MKTTYFSHIAETIAAAKRKADTLAPRMQHAGLAGDVREIATKNCVQPFLTQSYQCGTGKVIDSRDAISDQIDIIVYHRKVAPPIMLDPRLGFFPIECVRYIFEVKSRLTAPEIRDANKKFTSIARLISFPKPQPDGTFKSGRKPATVLLAFDSDISGSEIERYLKHTEIKPPPCIALCVLGKGYWFWRENEWYGQETTPDDPAFQSSAGSSQVL